MDSGQTKERFSSSARWIGIGFLLGLIGIVSSLALIWFIAWNLPSVASLKDFRPPVVSEVWSEEFVKIGEFYQERRIFVPLSQIPAPVVQAFVAAEDSQFFKHKGISLPGIARAMFKNLLAGRTEQGGSTITQQVAKQLLLTPERSFTRKFREAFLAYKMERFLSKEEILEIYLNQIYLGHTAYGVAAAAQTYFGKDLSDLTLSEAAVLGGLPRAPSRDNPKTSLSRAREKQAYVLQRMTEERYITRQEKDAALAEPLRLASDSNVNLKYAPYFVEHVRRYVTEKYGDAAVLTGGLQIYTGLRVDAALAAQRALREGIEELDRRQGYRGPIERIPQADRPGFIEKLQGSPAERYLEEGTPTQGLVTEVNDAAGWVKVNLGNIAGVIPIEEMRWARKPNPEELSSNHLLTRPSQALAAGDVILVRRAPEGEGSRKTPSGTIRLSLAQEPKVQGALVSLEPQTGILRSMVGGYDFGKSEFNRAVQARRQPGSAFKPIIYSAALDRGYTPASILVDAPFTYDDPTTDFHWRPKNSGGKFFGNTIFRDCLIESRNVPTIKIVQDLGIDTVLSYAQRMGISSPLARNFSLALGSSGVTLMELVSVYSVFPNGGKKLKTPIAVKKIVGRDGNVLERNEFADPALDVLEQAALSDQVSSEASREAEAVRIGKDPAAELPEGYALSPQTSFIMTHLLKQVITSGTGRRAAAINRPAAGKTGTTNDNRDAWFVGFTPTLVTGVWLGSDDSAVTLGVGEEGGRAASPIWLAFMEKALEGTPPSDFKVPEGVVFVQIDPRNGLVATAQTKNAVFEVFREGSEPKETTDEEQAKKSSQQFFLQE
jgi:penicillin-binding protein 1A